MSLMQAWVVIASSPAYAVRRFHQLNIVSGGDSVLLFRSMMFAALGIVTLAGIPGCGEDSGGREASKPGSPAAPATTAAAPKRAGFPALPKGAGPIDDDAPEEFTETDSGLKYRILRKSDGRKPVLGEGVEASYKGWFEDGKQFDSSYDKGRPLRFAVQTGPGGVIPAWVEAVQLIGVGGMIEIIAPSDLAYGERGHPAGIPPNATLHFIIELTDVR
jgi:FKBP-type peptidyl-prolyl cis-trans isomerase FkpA